MTTISKRSIDVSQIEVKRLNVNPKILTNTGIALLVLLVAVTWSNYASRLSHAYLLSVVFFLSINLGALFFVNLQHLTNAKWSVTVRRLAELIASTLPTTGLLMLPIIVPLLFGGAQLYEWNDATIRETDELVQKKAAYLNAPFFVLRCGIYIAVWILMSRFFLNNSLRQDASVHQDGNDARMLANKMRRYSGPAMIAYTLTINFAAFDLLMTLDPHWFSAIFGIYFFSGGVVAFFATLPLVVLALQRFGYLKDEVTTEHFHDLGKLLFGFLFFWAYIAFSQYLLIWYANIPEETLWFLARQTGSWKWIGLLVVFGHLIVPFFGLMSRSVRRNRNLLAFWSIFLLVMHWCDLYWVVMPNVLEQPSVGMIEIVCFLSVGAIWLANLLRSISKYRLVPTGDPNLLASLNFHNH